MIVSTSVILLEGGASMRNISKLYSHFMTYLHDIGLAITLFIIFLLLKIDGIIPTHMTATMHIDGYGSKYILLLLPIAFLFMSVAAKPKLIDTMYPNFTDSNIITKVIFMAINSLLLVTSIIYLVQVMIFVV